MEIPKLTVNESLDLQAELELDLAAYYKTLYDEIMETIENHSDKSLDDIIHEVTKKI